MIKLIWLRRAAQIFVLFLFILLPWLNFQGFHEIQGSLFSFNFFGIPYADPASACQAIVSGQHPFAGLSPEYLWGALFSLCVAFFLGRIFCSWLCPYGLFSDVLHKLRVRANKPMPQKEQKKVWLLKCGFFCICLLCCIGLAAPAITFLSFPGQISLWPLWFWQDKAGLALYALLYFPIFILVIEIFNGKRLWCEKVCPQSVLLGLVAWLLPKWSPGLRINWSPKKCNCGLSSPCAAACPLNINPRHKNGPERNVCVMCGDCVEACKNHGKALSFSMGPGGVKKPKAGENQQERIKK